MSVLSKQKSGEDEEVPAKQVPRVLFVTYVFPPVGGAGVQRPAKLAKYLPEFGWAPSVLTAANPSVPLRDESLVRDIAGIEVIRRARTYEPGYAMKAAVAASGRTRSHFRIGELLKFVVRSSANVFLQPDPQILWVPNAIHEGRRLLSEISHKAILVSAPPFSAFLIGANLSRRFGIPLVLDYRDEWDLSNAHWENRRFAGVARSWQRRLQSRMLRAATVVVAATQSMARVLRDKCAQAGSKADVCCLYNGYDSSDFPECPPLRQGGADSRFRLTYVGTLWDLTSIEPFVQAVTIIAKRRPDLVAHLEFCIAGRQTGDQKAILERLLRLPCHVVQQAYVDHDTAVQLMLDSDSLCVFLTDAPGAERIATGKLFEYMAARRPILAIAPKGELWGLLARHPAAYSRHPTDVEGIATDIMVQIEAHLSGKRPNLDGWDPSPYSRRNQARELAAILNTVTVTS